MNDDTFGYIRDKILRRFKAISRQEEGKFCGFAWFVVPKILINQKYRVRRMLNKDPYNDIEKEDDEEEKKDNLSGE